MFLVLTDFVVPGKMTADHRMKRISVRAVVFLTLFAVPGKNDSGSQDETDIRPPARRHIPGICRSGRIRFIL